MGEASLHVSGRCRGEPLQVDFDGREVTLTLGEGERARREVRDAGDLICEVGKPEVPGLAYVAILFGVFPVAWLGTADTFDALSFVALTALAACVALLIRATVRLRWLVVLASRREFVAFDCGWRGLNATLRLERALERGRLARAWAPRSLLNPLAILTELRLILPSRERLEAQYEAEQSPMRRAQYLEWRPRHALAVSFFGLLLPTLVALGVLLTREEIRFETVLGTATLWISVLLPGAMATTNLVRRALLSVDEVPEEVKLRPMFPDR